MAKIKFSETSRNDIESIWQYIAENNPQAANNFLLQLKDKFELLANTPKIGRLRQDVMLELRSFPYKKYVIFYFPTDEGIEIFRVVHGSRDIETLFDDMLPSDSVN